VSGAPQIPGDLEWQPVRVIFAREGLDPKDPQHWLEIVRRLARAVSKDAAIKHWGDGPLPLPGKAPRWPARKLEILLLRVENLRKRFGEKDEKVCKRLTKHRDYDGLSDRTLRRRLSEARRLRG
jgi:hypothetical protein